MKVVIDSQRESVVMMKRTTETISRSGGGSFRGCLFVCLLVSVTLQSTLAGRVRGDGVSLGRKLDLPVYDDLDPVAVMLDNDRDSGKFPGETLVIESSPGVDRTAGWTRMKQPKSEKKESETASSGTGPYYYYGKHADSYAEPDEHYASTVYGWKWKSKYKYYNTKGSCKTSEPTMSPQPSGSPSVSLEPSSSAVPSGSPSLSPEPSVSAAPSPVSKKASKTSHPTVSLVPSGSPSLSFQPSESLVPSGEPSLSFEPTMTFSPTKSGSKSAKSSRCVFTGQPSVSSAPSIPMEPTVSPAPSDSSAPSLTPSVSNAPSISSAPTVDFENFPVCARTADDDGPPDFVDGEVVFLTTVELTFTASGTFNNDDLLALLTGTNQGLRLGAAGCWFEFNQFIDTFRRLLHEYRVLAQQEDSTKNLAFATTSPEGWVSDDDCDGVSSGSCTESFDTRVRVSYVDPFNKIDKTGQNIARALRELLEKLVEDNNEITSATVSYVGVESVTGPASATLSDNSIQSRRTSYYIGAAAGLLTLLLLIVLLARRRRSSSDEVSHLKLDDEGDETFIREFDSNTDDSPYKSRRAHVIGEEDSIFSGWTGYTKGGGSDDGSRREGFEPHLGRAHGDVHVCSSATCEVCERRRQQGLQFIPTGAPPRPQTLPTDAEREYFADDTVEL